MLGRLGWAVLLFAALGVGGWQVASWRAMHRSAAALPPAPRGPTQPPSIRAEGRLDARVGAKVTVSAEVVGVLTNIAVREKSPVQAGDLIAELKADDVYASLMESRARVSELEAEIQLAQSELRRGRALAETAALTTQELERLVQRLDTLMARRITAQVTVQRLEITLAKTRITAPIGGVVLARYVHAGEVVTEGSPIVTLIDLERTWIEAEVDEYDIARVKVGAEALIRAEGYPQAWRGQVEEVPDSVRPRVLPPQDPAQPSDVRVLPVKIALPERTPLKLGQRVEVEIRSE